jgi:hypothetical protein
VDPTVQPAATASWTAAQAASRASIETMIATSTDIRQLTVSGAFDRLAPSVRQDDGPSVARRIVPMKGWPGPQKA